MPDVRGQMESFKNDDASSAGDLVGGLKDKLSN